MTDLPPDDASGPDTVLDPDDQRVLDELAAALSSHRDVEPRHREAARAAFTWRTVDSELLELTYDSLDTPAAVRGPGGPVGTEPRALSFATAAGSLEVELDEGSVRGHVVPAAVVTVVMSNAAGDSVRAESDEDGMFELPGTLAGPVRFTVEGDGAGTTPWVTV